MLTFIMEIPLWSITKHSTNLNELYSWVSGSNSGRYVDLNAYFGDINVLDFNGASSLIMMSYTSTNAFRDGATNNQDMPHVMESFYVDSSSETMRLLSCYSPRLSLLNSYLIQYHNSSTNRYALNHALCLNMTKQMKTLAKTLATINDTNAKDFNISQTHIFDVLDVLQCNYLVICQAFNPNQSNLWSNTSMGSTNHWRLECSSTNRQYLTPLFGYTYVGMVPYGINYCALYNAYPSLTITLSLNGYPLPPPTNSTHIVATSTPLFPYITSNIVRVKNLPLTLTFKAFEPYEIMLNGVLIKSGNTTHGEETYVLDVDPKDEVAWRCTNSTFPWGIFLTKISVRS